MNATSTQIECSLKINVLAEFYKGYSLASIIFYRNLYSGDATMQFVMCEEISYILLIGFESQSFQEDYLVELL
jgi:hypothetical protein